MPGAARNPVLPDKPRLEVQKPQNQSWNILRTPIPKADSLPTYLFIRVWTWWKRFAKVFLELISWPIPSSKLLSSSKEKKYVLHGDLNFCNPTSAFLHQLAMSHEQENGRLFLKKIIIYSGWQQIFKGQERETHALLCSPSQTLTLGSHRSRLSSLGLADLSMRFNCSRRVSLQHKRRLSFRPYIIKYKIAWNTIASVCVGDTRSECTAMCISQESNEGKTSYQPTHSSRS